MQTAIWQLRTKFEPRSVNGASFFVHTDPQSKRVAKAAESKGNDFKSASAGADAYYRVASELVDRT